MLEMKLDSCTDHGYQGSSFLGDGQPSSKQSTFFFSSDVTFSHMLQNLGSGKSPYLPLSTQHTTNFHEAGK